MTVPATHPSADPLTPRFSPLDEALREDPYPVYAHFRSTDPIHRGADIWGGAVPWYLFRLADAQAFLRDNRAGHEWWRLEGEAGERPQPPEPEPGTFASLARHWMLFRDPPDHTRLRTLANTAFTPKRIAARRPAIEQLANDLLDAIDPTGPVDLIKQFAFPLPVLVIADILGVPEEDRGQFRNWSAILAAAIDLPVGGLASLQADQDAMAAEVSEYLRSIIAKRRADPRDDLISAMIAATSEGDRFNEQELIATIVLLLFAGHETTVNLIGNGTLALLRHPDQWRHLVARPELATNATEELLRYDSPVQMTSRVVFEEMEIGGVTFPRGTEVFAVLGSANRDPDAFDDPGRLDITRSVGRIMTFGQGIHFCLGSPLARLEGAVAFETLTRRLPGLTLAGEPVWRAGIILHGLQSLPVVVQ